MKAKIIKTACVYVGIIFGAGFASGQEHLSFFLPYGLWSLPGIFAASALIALCGWAVMDICVRRGISNYKDFMEAVFGKVLGGILDVVTGLFIFVIFSAMLAGSGAMGSEVFGLPISFGAAAAAALAFAVLLFDLRGMVEVNTLISPILIAGSLIVGLLAIFGEARPAAAFGAGHAVFWPLSAVIYASYNMLTAAAVLSGMPALVNHRKIAKYGGLLGGGALALIGVVLAAALYVNPGVVRDAQLPMLALAESQNVALGYFYAVLLFLAIFTTLVTGGFSLVQWLAARTGKPKMPLRLGITLGGFAASHIGFSTIVARVYSFFGFLGLFIVVTIIIHFVAAGD